MLSNQIIGWKFLNKIIRTTHQPMSMNDMQDKVFDSWPVRDKNIIAISCQALLEFCWVGGGYQCKPVWQNLFLEGYPFKQTNKKSIVAQLELSFQISDWLEKFLIFTLKQISLDKENFSNFTDFKEWSIIRMFCLISIIYTQHQIYVQQPMGLSTYTSDLWALNNHTAGSWQTSSYKSERW